MQAQLLDVGSVREQFPAIHQAVNGHPLAYLDSAASTQRPEVVLQSMDRFYRHDNANVHRGAHALSDRATEGFERARENVRAFVNAASVDEIVFTKGCTESLNLVASSWGKGNLREGDEILISGLEHHSNIVPWQLVADETGARLRSIPVTDSAELDLEELQGMLTERVKAVAVKHVCNATGTISPIREIAKMAHSVGAIAVIDGAQALAHVPVDVQALDVDFYAVSAHKVYGPMGFGALYGRKELLNGMRPYQGGGGMIKSVSIGEITYADPPGRFEAGTPHVAGAIGFGEALLFISGIGIEAAAKHENGLMRRAESALLELGGVRIVGGAKNKAAIVSFVLDCAHPHDVGTVLDKHGVAVRTGHHCCMPLMKRMGIPATTRASFAAYSSEEDVDQLVSAVAYAKEMFS